MRAQEFIRPQLREDIENFPIANVRRPNGAIGNQGVNTEQAAGFWDKHRGEDVRVWENFADGRHPEDKGDSARHGIPKKATMAELEKASHAKGRKGQLARWQLNMRRGHKK